MHRGFFLKILPNFRKFIFARLDGFICALGVLPNRRLFPKRPKQVIIVGVGCCGSVPQQSVQSHLIGILEIPFDASTVLERRIEEPACRGSVHGYERHLLILSLQTAATLVAGVASPAASTIFLIRTMGGRFEMKAYRPFCFRHGDTTFKGEAPIHHRFHQ